MKKLIVLGLLSLVTVNYLSADEYISDAYFEEISAQTEIVYDSMEFLPITQTIEEQAREKSKVIEEEVFLPIPITPRLIDEQQGIQALTYETVLEQAKREGKIIMLSIRSTTCKYCDKMDRETLSDESVKEALSNDFITVHYNQDLEPLPLNLQEGATPMFIFVNTNEDILNMYPGMRSPNEFKEALREILAQ